MDKIKTVIVGNEKYYDIDDVGTAFNIVALATILVGCDSTLRTRIWTPGYDKYMLTKKGVKHLIKEYNVIHVPADLYRELHFPEKSTEDANDTKNNTTPLDTTPISTKDDTKDDTKEVFFKNIKSAFPDEEILMNYPILEYIVDAYLPRRKIVIDFEKSNYHRINVITAHLSCVWLKINPADNIFECCGRITRAINEYKTTRIGNLYSDNDSIVENVVDVLSDFTISDGTIYHLHEDALTTALNHTIQLCKLRTVLCAKLLNQK